MGLPGLHEVAASWSSFAVRGAPRCLHADRQNFQGLALAGLPRFFELEQFEVARPRKVLSRNMSITASWLGLLTDEAKSLFLEFAMLQSHRRRCSKALPEVTDPSAK